MVQPMTRHYVQQTLHHYHLALRCLHQCLDDPVCHDDQRMVLALIATIGDEQRLLRQTLGATCGEGFVHG